jgi:hypothetical protein
MIPLLISYAIPALGLAATLLLFLGLKREIHARSVRERKRVNGLLERMREPEPEPASAPPMRSGLNLNLRVQALRLLRRGEDIDRVAQVLSVPRCEIALLARVQEIAAQDPPQASGKAAGE